jgi:L-alanine-DL-glutamate epimerase-like enolase superfamily enzyme
MKITKIVGFSLSSPYGNGKGNVMGQPLGFKSVGFVEVYTDSGLIGLGETYAGVYAPELIEPVARFIGARLVGLNPLEPEKIAEKAQIPFISRNGLFCSVYSAIDIALWDIAGQAAGKPIHELLNSNDRSALKTYASGGSAAIDANSVAADAASAREKGFSAFKMRVGVQDWRIDLERINAAKEALGNKTGLMIDAIMGTISPPWTIGIALKRIKDLERFNPIWLEEPLHPDDMINLRRLRGATSVPVASGEALTGFLDYSSYLSSGAIDVIQVDPTHCGGLSIGKKIIEMAHGLGIRTAMHVWGSSAAIAANTHLAFSHPNVEWLEVPMVPFELSSKMSSSTLNQGSQALAKKPTEPGLGAALTSELKAHYKMIPGSGYKL